MATTSLKDIENASLQAEFLRTLNAHDLLAALQQLQQVLTTYADFLPESPEEDEVAVDPTTDHPACGLVRSSLAQVMDDQQRLADSLIHLRGAALHLPEEDESTVDLRTLLMCINQDYVNPALQALATWISKHHQEETPSTPLHVGPIGT